MRVILAWLLGILRGGVGTFQRATTSQEVYIRKSPGKTLTGGFLSTNVPEVSNDVEFPSDDDAIQLPELHAIWTVELEDALIGENGGLEDSEIELEVVMSLREIKTVPSYQRLRRVKSQCHQHNVKGRVTLVKLCTSQTLPLTSLTCWWVPQS